MSVMVESRQSNLPDQGKLNYKRAWILENHKWSKDAHEQRWCRDHLEFYGLYRNFSRGGIDPDDFHSNITLGLAFPLVKILAARLAAPWQSGDSIMEVHPTDTLSIEKAPMIAALVNDTLTRKIPRAFSKLELAKESACALGRGIIKPRMARTAPQTRLKRNPITLPTPMPLPGYPSGVPLGSYLSWERTEPGAHLTFDYVDPFQMWWIGSDRFADNAHTTFEETYLWDAEVISRQMSGEFNVPFDFEPNGGLGFDQYYERRSALDWNYGDQVISRRQGAQAHRYLEVQGLVETRRRQNGQPVYESRIVGILDEKWIVKDDRLGSWNGKPEYIIFDLFQDIGSDRPMGLIEPCEQVLYAIDDFVSIGFDNARKIVESTLAVDPDQTDQTEIYLGAAAINWIRNPQQSVRPIEMKDLPSSFYELLQHFNEILYRVSGISDLFGGVPTNNLQGGAQTARGMGMLLNQSSGRMAPIASKMDRELYRPLAQWIHRTAALRFDGEHAVRLAGSKPTQFQSVTAEDLDFDVDYSFNTKALDAASGTRRADFLQVFELLSSPEVVGLFGQQGLQLDMYEASRMLMSEYDRGADVPKLIKRLQQLQAPMAPGAPTGPFASPGNPPAPGAPMPPGAEGGDGEQPAGDGGSPTGLPAMPSA